MTRVERDYVLGTHDDEITRLGLQHRVWRPRVLDAWRRAGFSVGQSLVDVGSGPGHATLDLAQIVGPGGRVVAIERSRRFLDAMQAAQRERGLDWIEGVELDLDDQDPPHTTPQADGAWCRWVLCFVKRPREVLANVAALLRPGGALVLHEYVDYSTWRLAPACPELEEFVAAVMQSWRAQGGEPDIALSIPRWLGELGFEIRSLQPIVEVIPPTSFVWQWPRSFVEVGLHRLVELGYFTRQRASEILAAVAAAEATPHTLMITPAVLEIIATKESRSAVAAG
jgi:SAM-dependent methyltransferase